MSRHASTQRHERGVLHRAAAAVCPGPQRPWIEAMFAEFAAIEGTGNRVSWMIGAWSVVIAAVGARAGAVVTRRNRSWGLLALLGAAVLGTAAFVDYERVGVDDDILAALAIASGVLAAVLAAVAVSGVLGTRGAWRILGRDTNRDAGPGIAPGD